MKIEDLKTFEIEITSVCNAVCPGCLRTRHDGGYELLSLTLADIKRILPSENYIKDKQFLLCGALGDPVANKDCFAICEYITSMGGYVMINSNASLETESWWKKLGKLSADTQKLQVWFCVDGYEETNHIYRVNTNFDIIKRNMAAYAAGGEGNAGASWIYIIFDHNEHEVELAREHATRLGFKFATRTGAGNSMTNWVSNIRKKDKQTREVTFEKRIITTTGSKEHSKKQLIMELNNFIKNDKAEIDKQTINKIVKSIKCKFYHEGEMFIASNQTLWPCCFLWSNSIRDPELYKQRFSNFDQNWNSLLHHSIDDIMQNPWFSEILKDSWDPAHAEHIPKCIQNCAYEKAHQNEINYVNK
jgi:MoaA/NifB/PqqE/SkfB family radical SAM enzyme